MAFIGFIGQIGIFRFVKKHSHIQNVYILIVVFLLPTFVLWSASILKEPLIIFSMGLLLFFMGKWTKKWKAKYFWSFIFFLVLGFIVKPYVILSLILPIALFIYFKIKKSLSFKKQALIVATSLTIILLFFQILTFTDFNVFDKLSKKQADFNAVIEQVEQTSEVGSKININPLEPHVLSFLENSPKAFLIVLFSPYFTDFGNLLYWPDMLQNSILILLVILMLKYYQFPPPKSFPFLWLALLFVLILFVIIGLVTPIMGAIVRYKIPALIFVYFLLLLLTNKDLNLRKINAFLFYKSQKTKNNKEISKNIEDEKL
jgi:hypothetical protein